MSTPPDPDAKSRRQFLCRAAGAGAATVGLALAAPPLVVLVTSPFASTPEPADRWVALGPPARFPLNTPTRVVLKYEQRDAWVQRAGVPLGTIWVQRRSDADFLIHSARCTHLGCAVTVSEDHFACPCHGATFDLSGALRPGDNPAKRPLDTLESRLANGTLEVRFQRFRLDTEAKEPVA